jgi:hypothetical protein
MDSRAQTPQDPARRDPPVDGGPGSHAQPPPAPQGRPALNVGPAFARTVRHFFPDFNAWLDEAPDPRRADRITYPRRFLLWYGVLLFAGKLGSRRQLDFKYREPGACVLDNLNRLAQTDQSGLPCNDTLDDYLALIGAAPVAAVRARAIHRLIRMRVLDSARVQGRLVVAIDGSGYLVFRWRHCEHCLTRQAGEQTRYCHQVLEAKILGPAETVLSLGSEFIDNRDQANDPVPVGEEKRKQDCELKAAGRLLRAVRAEFPQVRLCLSLDALYACGTAFQLGQEHRVSYVIVFKRGSIPTLWQEFQTLLGLCAGNRREVQQDGWRHVYRWVDALPYTDSEGRDWKLKAVHYAGEGPQGERSEWAWLLSDDLVVNASTVEKLVWGAGRPRWREENQGFNVQKNSGLNLEHAYSEKGHFGAYYLLLQLAHLLLQLLEKGSLLRDLARRAGKRSAVALLGSLKNIAEFLVESLRNWAWPAETFARSGRQQIRLDSS